MKKYIIYKHTSPSGKSYIGQTCNLHRRNLAHQKESSACRAFLGAIKKYGWENFSHEILEENITAIDANILEIEYIKYYNTLNPYGYNLSTGGLNHLPSDESKLLMSLSSMGEKNPMYGKPSAMRGKKHTMESLEKMSKSKSGKNHPMYGKQGSMLGKKHTEETLEKMRKPKSSEHKKNLSKSKTGEKNPMYGKKHTKETINKLKDRKATLETRRKMCEARKQYWEEKRKANT